jgi:hypothetical protein
MSTTFTRRRPQYSGRVIRMLVLMCAVAFLAGCNNGDSFTTPSHGGYRGRAASLCETARSTCKHQLAAGASA